MKAEPLNAVWNVEVSCQMQLLRVPLMTAKINQTSTHPFHKVNT